MTAFPAHLTRKVFRSSRLAEFATVAELIRQTGHPVADWPLIIAKELADNGLDAAEGAGTAPSIEIVVADNSVTVADYGPGIASATVASLIDYSVRTSSRAAYTSPTRGAQGNALQSIIPMGFALSSGNDDSEDAGVLIESQGVAHAIRFAVDPVRQTPVISCDASPSEVKRGTRITVRWPDSPRSIIAGAEDGFLSLVSAFAWFNPHLTIRAEFMGSERFHRRATDPDWKKWRPDLPTSAHWYCGERLKRLITAEIAHAEDSGTACPSVRDFIGQFRGLSHTAKARAICKEIGVAERLSLADFYKQRADAVGWLLSAMKQASRPVKPRDLGVVGRDHLLARFAESGGNPETFVYKRAETTHDGLPTVIEAAFALNRYAEIKPEEDVQKRIIEGFNFTAAIGGSPFKLEGRLAEARIEDDDPVIAFIHLTSPRLDFLDRGKARLALPIAVAAEMNGLVSAVTKTWTKQKRAEIRDAQARVRRWDAMVRRDKPVTQKDAAYVEMPEAHRKASANKTLPANPRQVFYVARGPVEEATGQTLGSKYFTQTLLPDFMADNPELTADWDIVWDDRGHFREPHTGHEIGLGTLAVRKYIADIRDPEIKPVGIADANVSTIGPPGRYGAVLFIEKEGFTPIVEAAGIPERFDISPMSTKGMSVTAARMLVEELCGRLGLPLFVMHDFDVSGFSIKKTLISDTERFTFRHKLVKPIDLGLRLADVERLGLASERVVLNSGKDALRRRLKINAATPAEIDFLLHGLDRNGQRVELNALTSDQFVRFVEDKLSEHGVAKIVPETTALAETYAALRRGALARQAFEAELRRINGATIDRPANLEQRVRAYLAEHPEETWDAAVRAVAEENDDD